MDDSDPHIQSRGTEVFVSKHQRRENRPTK